MTFSSTNRKYLKGVCVFNFSGSLTDIESNELYILEYTLISLKDKNI